MSEKIDWVNHTPDHIMLAYIKWREAIVKADETGDLGALVQILRSETSLGPDARDKLATLLDRHSLKKKKGGQKANGLKITSQEGRMRGLQKLVGYHQRKGLSREDAIHATLREKKREKLELAGDDEFYTDEDIDFMISDEEFSELENRMRKNPKW